MFYSNKGEVFTVLVDDKEKFLQSSDILILLNFLEDRILFWATVPDVLCVHRGSSMINSRFGQAVVINDEVCDATVEDLALKHRIVDSRQNEDGFNNLIKILSPSIPLKLKIQEVAVVPILAPIIMPTA